MGNAFESCLGFGLGRSYVPVLAWCRVTADVVRAVADVSPTSSVGHLHIPICGNQSKLPPQAIALVQSPYPLRRPIGPCQRPARGPALPADFQPFGCEQPFGRSRIAHFGSSSLVVPPRPATFP